MGSYLIKTEREQDRYIYWSDQVEAPHAMAGRLSMGAYLAQHHGFTPEQAEHALAHADEHGSSAMLNGPYIGWDDVEGPIFEQRGMVPRAKLWEFCGLIFMGRREDAYDLMTPFEDVGEVRRW